MSKCPWASWTCVKNMCSGTVMKQVYAEMIFSLSDWINNMFLNLFPASPNNHLGYCNFANVRKANGRYHFYIKHGMMSVYWLIQNDMILEERRQQKTQLLSPVHWVDHRKRRKKKSPCTVTFFLPFPVFYDCKVYGFSCVILMCL